MNLLVGTGTKTVSTGVTATSKSVKKQTRKIGADLTMVVVNVRLTTPKRQ